jgi:hypothetical protein
MRWIVCWSLVLTVLVWGQLSLAWAAEQVDLLLVLASDLSRGVDHPKFLLQRQGYAAATSNPRGDHEEIDCRNRAAVPNKMMR